MTDYVFFDVETDGFDYTKILCIAVKFGMHEELFTRVEDFQDYVSVYISSDCYWVGHNSCGFDYWAINELTNVTIPRTKILDTSVLSKLHDYRKYTTHSLAEIGEDLGCPKSEYTGGFEEYNDEMGEYCQQDVRVCQKIMQTLARQMDVHSEASQVEHEMALISAEMQETGFRFNKRKAEGLLENVKEDMAVLEKEMQAAFPPEIVEDRRIQWRMTKAGVPHAACTKAQDAAPAWAIEGDELVLYKWKEFNPGSPTDRIDKLWDAGWKPYDKTKGHLAFEREKRRR